LKPERGWGGTGFGEDHFRVAAAEAWLRAGAREEAEDVLREARRQLELRAAKIPDGALKESFLFRNKQSARALDLARTWLDRRG
jgi:hypothetical protein